MINAVNFAKRTNGTINVLFVINPTTLSTSENPLNFIKSIEDEYSKIENKLKKLIEIIREQEKIGIAYKVEFGNLSTIVKTQIKKINPDVILINYNRLKKNILSRKIIPDYLDDYNGSILISNEKKNTLPKEIFKLGCFESEVFLNENKFIKNLLINNSSTVNVFLSSTNNNPSLVQKFKKVLNNKVKVFEFETKNQNLGILKYLKFSKSDLLCIHNPSKEEILDQYEDVINKSKLPFLIIKS